MRSGTSKGPFIDLNDLPNNIQERDAILMTIMGTPDPKEIDGLGGATSVTSKVVLVQRSERRGIDVDYLFAQMIIDRPIVDTSPSCGNMMAGVGPFAIEHGWARVEQKETVVKVYNINTQSIIDITVQTPNGVVNYSNGDCAIDGVPGTAAPILMTLYDLGGGATGKLFPTGKMRESIQGIEVSIVDAEIYCCC